MTSSIKLNSSKLIHTVYPKKYAHGFCFAVLCCGYTLTDFPISIRLTSLALWQSNDCHSASKATLMNMDKYFMWIHYERLHNHNKAKHNKTVCIFLGIYCRLPAVYFFTKIPGFFFSKKHMFWILAIIFARFGFFLVFRVFLTCFEISIWNLVYTFILQCHTSSSSFIPIGTLWPTLQPKCQSNFSASMASKII